MMIAEQKILVVGASGALGSEIVKLLKEEGRNLRVLTHSDEGVSRLSKFSDDIWNVDAAQDAGGIKNITQNVNTVISALGKSISLFATPEVSFYENDFKANKNLLDDAVRNGVQRFIYVSIKGVDSPKEYSVARAHKLFENELRASGIDYTILRPVGFYSGLNDLAIMAKRKFIPLIGSGKAKTNSIHPKDLAKVIVSFREKGPKIIEVGGPNTHTRLEMAQMVKEIIGGRIITIPEPIAKLSARLGLPKIFGKGIHDKLDYFTFITTNDMIGEANGSISFREYLGGLDLKKLT
ncbi:NAD(P)H-binding protein [Salegentibacter sp. JZCK2]|uniref:SDR family oxidoreductase n=1 Tax=Salegentibacter tibetensis TaxID=2873600 RepID=UPI001CCEB1C0|nr:NAD(P)H-binding protein [Salegentibacter tibetensis]MBZ9728398.1 NAD(P)H-binding protein [Salegentibacter tibetensis]